MTTNNKLEYKAIEQIQSFDKNAKKKKKTPRAPSKEQGQEQGTEKSNEVSEKPVEYTYRYLLDRVYNLLKCEQGLEVQKVSCDEYGIKLAIPIIRSMPEYRTLWSNFRVRKC